MSYHRERDGIVRRTSLVKFAGVTEIPSDDASPKVIGVPKIEGLVGIEIEYRGCPPESMVYITRSLTLVGRTVWL